MDFSFMSDDDISELSASGYMLKLGKCEYLVLEASDHTSAAGNKSFKIKLNVKDSSGKKAYVYDFLSPKAQLIPFLVSQGMQDAIDNRRVSASALVGKSGVLKIKHQEYNGEKQNKVDSYLREKALVVTQKADKEFDPETDVPF